MRKTINLFVIVTTVTMIVAFMPYLAFGSDITAPTKLMATATTRSVNLVWGQVNSASMYQVYSKVNGKYVLVKVAKTNHTKLHVKRNAISVIRVKAIADGYASNYSTWISVKAGGKNVTSIKLSGKSKLKKGSTTKLKATMKSRKSKSVFSKNKRWSSSNTSIATVSSKGVVKAKKSGTVKITCMAHDGITKSKTITVYSGSTPTKPAATINGTPIYAGVTYPATTWGDNISGYNVKLTSVSGPLFKGTVNGMEYYYGSTNSMTLFSVNDTYDTMNNIAEIGVMTDGYYYHLESKTEGVTIYWTDDGTRPTPDNHTGVVNYGDGVKYSTYHGYDSGLTNWAVAYKDGKVVREEYHAYK